MNRLLNIFFLLATAIHIAYAADYEYNQQQGSIRAKWKLDDMCGILTTSGTQIIHWITDGGSNQGTLSAYGWALSPDAQYYAYFPYTQSYNPNKTPMTALPVSYTEQSQSQNGNMKHLNTYDYMTAQAVSSADACHFSFCHIGSVIRMECCLQGSQTLQSLTISSQGKEIVTSGIVDVTTGMMTPTAYSEAVALQLNNIQIRKGEKLVAYLMLPPMDLTGTPLSVTITTADGYSATAKVAGTEILPGRLYPLELEMPEFTFSGNNSKGAPEAMGKRQGDVMKAAEVIIDSPTAYIPDFETDTEHTFVQTGSDDPATGIAVKESVSYAASERYSINGVRMSVAEKNRFYIRKGKKFLEQ